MEQLRTAFKEYMEVTVEFDDMIELESEGYDFNIDKFEYIIDKKSDVDLKLIEVAEEYFYRRAVELGKTNYKRGSIETIFDSDRERLIQLINKELS